MCACVCDVHVCVCVMYVCVMCVWCMRVFLCVCGVVLEVNSKLLNKLGKYSLIYTLSTV